MFDDLLGAARGRPVRDGLTVVLYGAVVVALVGVVYLAATPYQQTAPNTEFYLLGPDGVAADYPLNLSAGDRGEFVVGIENNEHRELTYTVVAELDGERFDARTTTVADGDTWETTFSVRIDDVGDHRVDVYLYRGSSAGEEPYRAVWLPVSVDG